MLRLGIACVSTGLFVVLLSEKLWLTHLNFPRLKNFELNCSDILSLHCVRWYIVIQIAACRIMEAEAKHDFQATAEDELSFPKNAVLKVSSSVSMWEIIFIRWPLVKFSNSLKNCVIMKLYLSHEMVSVI